MIERSAEQASVSALAYPARFSVGGDGRIFVEFADMPRVATDGKDEREAMSEAIDALGSDLSIRLSRGETIPAPSRVEPGERVVEAPRWLVRRLALHLANRECKRA